MKGILRNTILVSILFSLFSFPIFAAKSHTHHFKDRMTPHQNSWFLSVGGGTESPQYVYSTRINNGSGFIPPFNQDIYTTRASHPTVFTIVGGYRWEQDNPYIPAYSVGLNYQHVFPTNIGNQVIQYSTPAFTNYNAKWNVSSDVLLALGKVNLIRYPISPYLLGGLGIAFNRISNYNEASTPGVTAPRISPGFASNTNTEFAYNVGVGIDFNVSKQIILSGEYQYQSFGKFKSGYGSGPWSNTFLKLGSYTANSVIFSVTYLVEKC